MAFALCVCALIDTSYKKNIRGDRFDRDINVNVRTYLSARMFRNFPDNEVGGAGDQVLQYNI
jgi:hypothetical protein